MSQPGLPAAVLAGLLSFLSPCVLPLVPGYLSFISGYGAAEIRSGANRLRILARSLAFAAGFTAAFTVLGLVFSGGAIFAGQSGWLKVFGIASGIVIVLFGLNMLFDFVAFLNRELRFRVKGKDAGNSVRAVSGPGGAFVLGLTFAAGWSPCIGPILASILLFAGKEGNLVRSGLLLGGYSLGLAIPFIAAGLFFEKLAPAMNFFKRHGREVRIVSGIFLVLFGLVMAAGSLSAVSGVAVRAGFALQSAIESDPLRVRLIAACVILLGLLPFGFSLLKRSAGKKGAFRPAAMIVIAVLAILEGSGLVSITGLVMRWLLFTGS